MELFKLFGTIAIQNADANEQIDDTTDRAKESENQISGAFKKIGTAVATFFAVDKIKDFGLNCINAAADANAASSQFSQVFGDMESQAKKSLTGIADNTGIQVNRMKGSYTQIAAFAKTTGMDTSNALGLADRAMVAVADSAAFYDRTLEETTESLQSFLKGNYENDSALGLSCTEVTRNEAANRLYGKSFQDLSEAQKQLTLLQMVEDANKASGALGQAARESDTWTNQTGNLKQAWTDFQSVIGQKVLPLAVEAVKKASEAVQGLSEKMPTIIKTFKDWSPLITGVVTGFVTLKAAMAISSLISAVTTAWTAYKTANEGATIAQWLLNAALNANPIVLIVSLIAGLVVAIITLWNTSEEFRNFWIGLWETIKTAASDAWEAIKGAALAFWDWITSTANTVIDGMKEGWNSFKESVSDIWTAITDFCSSAWETIKNVVQVGIMFIGEIISFAFDIITLPWRFVWENVKEYVIPIWESIKSTVSNAISSVKTTIETVLNAIKTFFTNIWNSIKSIFETVLNTIKTVVGAAWNSIKDITISVFNAVKDVASSVWNSIKTAIENVVNKVKDVVSSVWNSIKDTTSSVFNGIKDTAKSVWDSIKSAIEKPINAAKDAVKKAIDKIKSFFDFEWSLPKLKLPHFEISGKFSLDPPSVPKFGIEWYKKAMDDGMIMNKPTVFGVNPSTGKFLAGGEAGSETVVGTESLMNMIQNAVRTNSSDSKLIEMLGILLNWLIGGGYKDMLIDVLVNHVEFEFDNREIIRLVKKYAG